MRVIFLLLTIVSVLAADPQQPKVGQTQVVNATNGYSGTLTVRTQLNLGLSSVQGAFTIDANGAFQAALKTIDGNALRVLDSPSVTHSSGDIDQVKNNGTNVYHLDYNGNATYGRQGAAGAMVINSADGSHTLRIQPNDTMTGNVNWICPASALNGIVKATSSSTTNSTLSAATAEVDYVTPGGIGTLSNKTIDVNDGNLSDDTAFGLVNSGHITGEAVSQWDVVYLDSSGHWLKADADAAGKFPCVGVATTAAGSGSAVTVLTRGTFRDDGGTAWTVGGVIYLSTTAGAMTQTAPSAGGSAVQAIGVALAAHRVQVNIVPIWFEN